MTLLPCKGCAARSNLGMAPLDVCPHQFALSVAAVVTDSDRSVLMIRRRDNGAWELPGGIIEPDESLSDGVVREVAEETGITIGAIRLVGMYKNPARMFLRSIFHGLVVEGTAQASTETTDVAWWPLAAVQACASGDMANAVLEAFATIDGGPVAVRLVGAATGQQLTDARAGHPE